jgi:hypothetical protein
MKQAVIKIIIAIIIGVALSSASIGLDLQQARITMQNEIARKNWGNMELAYLVKGSYADAVKITLSPNVTTGISTLEIPFIKVVHGRYLSQVLVTSNAGDSYEGFLSARIVGDNAWMVDAADIHSTESFKRWPFTLSEVGQQDMPDDLQYLFISGFINDKSIAYINIGFSDGLKVQARVNPSSKTYAYVRDDTDAGIKYVQGFSKDGHLIYQYSQS